jgi:hypothetical protein
MQKQERHGTESVREFSGEKSCRLVIEWLNDPRADAGRERIRQFLRHVQVLASNWVEVIDDDGEPRMAYRGSQEEFRRAYQDALGLLRRYKFSPLFFPFAGRMICQWVPISGPAGRFKGRWPPVAGKYGEYQAIYELTWNRGETLIKVKECFCGKWFFLRFAHQRFCGAKCRDKANKTLPQSKEYRRRKAREYYWLHKYKNIK